MIENEEINNTIYSCIKDLGICIVFNYTKNDFFLCCTSSTINGNSEKRYIINVPLTPKIMVRFCDINELKNTFNLKKDYMLETMVDENSVVEENLLIYNTTLESEPHVIIGNSQELEKIKELYEKFKKKL